MNIIDQLSNLNIDFGLSIQKQKALQGSNKFTEKKLRIGGTKVVVKEIQKYRRKMGMKALDVKIRQCLNCFDKFPSQGSHNRMCEDCAGK